MELSEFFWHNPSSPYRASARARNLLEDARGRLAERLGSSAEWLAFTGSATEANHMLVQYLAAIASPGQGLIISPFEHPSVREPALRFWQDRVETGPLDSQGQADMQALGDRLASGAIAAVCWMAASNESGAIFPWEALARLCHQHGVLFVCDASQYLGKLQGGDWSLCDAITVCAHKFGGPKGVGALRLGDQLSGFRSLLGGGQEKGRRASTENLPAIGAMMAALEDPGLLQWTVQAELRNAFEERIQAAIPGLKIIAQASHRLPNTSYLLVPKGDNLRWVRLLDKKGLEVSVGSACSTGKAANSQVLAALGYDADAHKRSLRISSGPTTTKGDWELLGDAFIEIHSMLEDESGGDGLTEVISI